MATRMFQLMIPLKNMCYESSSELLAISALGTLRSLSRYQPETQFAFLVDRLCEVNLYSIPTEIAKFTSYCE